MAKPWRKLCDSERLGAAGGWSRPRRRVDINRRPPDPDQHQRASDLHGLEQAGMLFQDVRQAGRRNQRIEKHPKPMTNGSGVPASTPMQSADCQNHRKAWPRRCCPQNTNQCQRQPIRHAHVAESIEFPNDNKLLNEKFYAASLLWAVSQPSIACLRAAPHI